MAGRMVSAHERRSLVRRSVVRVLGRAGLETVANCPSIGPAPAGAGYWYFTTARSRLSLTIHPLGSSFS
jgi:hypothetical protein